MATRAFDRARKGAESHLCGWAMSVGCRPRPPLISNPRVRIDEWVLPSHTQVARVAEGSLDLAIAWIEESEIESNKLAAHLLWYERLEAVVPRARFGGSRKTP